MASGYAVYTALIYFLLVLSLLLLSLLPIPGSITRVLPIDVRYKNAAIGMFRFFMFLSFVFILNLLCSRYYICLVERCFALLLTLRIRFEDDKEI